MLYLEDYLEMIEHLPIELRDRFTEMREIDLGVENTVDNLQDRQKEFFRSAATMPSGQREEEYNKIRKDYLKVVEESKEKIQIAEESYGLVDRYLRKLDQELHKFQLELEADNRGITEVLEKRSLELDIPSSSRSGNNSAYKENRAPKKLKSSAMLGNTTIVHGGSVDRVLGRVATSGIGVPTGGAGATLAQTAGGLQSSYTLEQIGGGSSAIAQAASQAIAATQLVAGRRSSSLKASYEAVNLGVASSEFSIGRELATAANSALAATSTDVGNPGCSNSGAATPGGQARMKQPKLKLPKQLNLGLDIGSLMDDMGTSVGSDHSASGMLDPVLGPSPSPGLQSGVSSPGGGLGNGGGLAVTPGTAGSDQEWNYDPNEPRYCICNQVSYGDMVACDNEDCPYEWFHYPCVGVTAPPKGKWYCQPCLASMRRRGRK